ncbi:MAG TPA: DUF3052 domain-containing protein [Gemmatimonadales bacterium]
MTPAVRATPGYSGKSLSEKLGIRSGMRVAAKNAPRELSAWLAPLPEGAWLLGPRSRVAECVLHFTSDRSDFAREMPPLVASLPEGGIYWVCWPKKSSGTATDVTENVIRALVLPTGWVDVKVCAVSDVWSGLKFLRRRH